MYGQNVLQRWQQTQPDRVSPAYVRRKPTRLSLTLAKFQLLRILYNRGRQEVA